MGFLDRLLGRDKEAQPTQERQDFPTPLPERPRPDRKPGPPTAWDLPDGAVVLKSGAGGFQEVAGEANYQDVLDRACGGRCEDGHNTLVLAELTREPDNQYDGNAVRVSVAEERVGYLPRGTAPAWKATLEALERDGRRAFCRALIVGGWDRGGGDRGHFGIKLMVASPADAVPKRATRLGSWAPDPTGRFALRFCDGAWTEHVWDGNAVVADAPPA